jgi:hypothetical protein
LPESGGEVTDGDDFLRFGGEELSVGGHGLPCSDLVLTVGNHEISSGKVFWVGGGSYFWFGGAEFSGFGRRFACGDVTLVLVGHRLKKVLAWTVFVRVTGAKSAPDYSGMSPGGSNNQTIMTAFYGKLRCTRK